MPERQPRNHFDGDDTSLSARYVHSVLTKVIPENSTRSSVSRSNPACAHLARILRRLRQLAQGWQGPYVAKETKAQKIAESIATLAELLPDLVRDYAAVIARSEGNEWIDPAFLEDERRNLDRLRRLHEACADIVDAGDQGPPVTVDLNVTFAPRLEKWEQAADHIAKFLEDCLPGISNRSVYEFIVEVMPKITGDHLTLDQVKQRFKRCKKRAANGGDNPD